MTAQALNFDESGRELDLNKKNQILNREFTFLIARVGCIAVFTGGRLRGVELELASSREESGRADVPPPRPRLRGSNPRSESEGGRSCYAPPHPTPLAGAALPSTPPGQVFRSGAYL